MKVIRARVLGFCMGVRRAVQLAAGEAKRGSPVYTLGSLIHNPKVLQDLKALGVHPIEGLPQNNDCTVIIRAHGISPDAESELQKTGCRIVDATCPKVKASQLRAQQLSRAGYCLFLAGEAVHAEIEGILGYTKDASFCAVVGSAEQAQAEAEKLLKTESYKTASLKNASFRTALLGQTTISEEEYRSIADEIKKYFPNLEIEETICAATAERQQALRGLLLECDAVIIAGGKESANTRRLLAIAQQGGKPCALVEEKTDIPESFYSCETVGLCAGASTPDLVIEEIEECLYGKSHFR